MPSLQAMHVHRIREIDFLLWSICHDKCSACAAHLTAEAAAHLWLRIRPEPRQDPNAQVTIPGSCCFRLNLLD